MKRYINRSRVSRILYISLTLFAQKCASLCKCLCALVLLSIYRFICLSIFLSSDLCVCVCVCARTRVCMHILSGGQSKIILQTSDLNTPFYSPVNLLISTSQLFLIQINLNPVIKVIRQSPVHSSSVWHLPFR